MPFINRRSAPAEQPLKIGVAPRLGGVLLLLLCALLFKKLPYLHDFLVCPMLDADELLAGFTHCADELVQLRLHRGGIRKVTMVVPVLMISCHVSE